MSESSQSPPPPPQWVLDLDSPPAPKQKPGSIPDPPGYSSASSGKRGLSKQQTKDQPARKPPTPEEMDTLKMKKAWEVAIAPAKQLPMNAIGMYMTGNSLQIFSIFMVLMLFKTPFTALVNIQSAFQRFESEGTKDKLLLVKLVYIATNLLAVGLGVWKVGKMGLLPTTRSDWLAWEAAREPLERAYPVFGT